MSNHTLINLKGRFPFRLATTSYILHEAIMPNLRLLGPLFDEIELVLFDSCGPDNLPAEADIVEMASLGNELRYSYNIHLPTDVLLGSADDRIRRHACETMLRYYKRTRTLKPTSYILHLERNPEDSRDIEDLVSWRQFLRFSLSWLLDRGMPRQMIAVENIDYPFSWVDILVEEFDLKVCLDLGHLILQGLNLPVAFNRYQERIIMMHLHGVGHRDHQGISLIPDPEWQEISQILRHFDGGLSLEVFSLDNLQTSLMRMEELL